ncbi:hypothetical protein CYY_005361 [Polysphondylium violaceum]|uniref:Uncharacterized protein n=1 Tax=Polysphondylium violaceum TaxID=133409 RepID=A0A8J4PT33_9MYCE|nr:hypothetical protein CYY_005361 [Polysphondylium violaceum]
MESHDEELVLQILFGLKNNNYNNVKNNNSAPASPCKKFRKEAQAPASPSLFGSSSQDIDFVPSSPSRGFLSYNSNKYEVPYSCESPTLLPPVPTLGSNRNLIPSPSNSLSNSTESLDSFTISSSPSQSVPSSPPFGKSLSLSSLKQQKFVSLKNNDTLSPSTSYTNLLSSSSPSVKIPSQSCNNNNNNNNRLLNIQCTLNECLLCQRGQPDVLVKSPTWASIMRVVFFTLHNEMKEKQFFSLKTDVYDFMTTHWDVLCLHKKRSDNWHKQIQDMLSHSKNIFESGMDKYKQNGFWRLKQAIDPWVLPQKGGRKSSSPSQSSPVLSLSASSPSILSSSPPSSSPSFYVPSISATTSPLILSNNNSCNIPNIKHKYHQSTTHLFDEGRKKSSIDNLLISSDSVEMVYNNNKKRTYQESQYNDNQRYSYSDDSEELYIDDDN